MRNFIHRVFFLLFSLFVTLSGYSQGYKVQNYTIKDGLPSNATRKVMKDSRGCIWIGTDAGAVRFDGKSFEVFNSLNGMPGDHVWGIAEDNHQNLWFACYDGGVTMYNGQNFKNYTKDNGLVHRNIRTISYSKQFDLIFAGADNGFSIIKDGKIESFTGQDLTGIPNIYVMGMYEGKEGMYIYSHVGGMFLYNPKSHKTTVLNKNRYIYNPSASSSFISSNKDTILGYNKSGFSLFAKNTRINYENLGQIFSFSEDNQKNIWIAAWSYSDMKEPGGLFKFDGKSITSMNKEFGIKSPTLFGVFCDNQTNTIWVASDNMGLYRCTPSIFKYYKSDFFETENVNIVDLLHINQKLWIVSPNCVYAMDKNEKLVSFKKDVFEREYNRSKKMYADRKLEQFTHVSADLNGNIWIVSNVGMFKILNQNQGVKYYPIENNGGLCQTVFDHKNRLYYGGWAFLYTNDDVDKNPIVETIFDQKPRVADIASMIKHNDEIWIGSSSSGVYRIKNGNIYSSKLSQPSLIKNVSDIYIDNSNNIIFGGTSGIVNIAQFIGDSLKINYRISKKNGLQGSAVSWLRTSNNDKYLWIATNTGLNRLNMEKLVKEQKYEINFYNASEGLETLNPLCRAIDDNGDLWAGSNSGLIKINTNNTTSAPMIPQIKLLSFEINNQPIHKLNFENIDLWTQLPKESIDLKYNQNDLVFTFGILNYENSEKDLFRYRLLGYDDKWSDFENSSKAAFTNLPPGDYTFCVESKNQSSGIIAKPLFVNFSINKPFWATWCFILFSILCVLMSIYAYMRFKIKKVKKQEAVKTEIAKKIAKYEMKALQAQMNPHFIFNAMNSIQNYILNNDTDNALKYLSDFANIIRQTLNQSSKNYITINEEISFLNIYIKLEQMRFKNMFEATITTGDLDLDSSLMPPMVIQPFVENAIKHGFAPVKYKGELLIRFEIEKEYLVCTIKDNGIGVIKAAELNSKNHHLYKSKGMDITAKRLDLMKSQNGDKFKIEVIDLSSENPTTTGTRVKIWMPLESQW